MKKDLKALGVSEDWYGEAQDRGKWRAAWSQSLSEHQHAHEARGTGGEKTVLCIVWGDTSGERVIRFVISVLLRDRGQ